MSSGVTSNISVTYLSMRDPRRWSSLGGGWNRTCRASTLGQKRTIANAGFTPGSHVCFEPESGHLYPQQCQSVRCAYAQDSNQFSLNAAECLPPKRRLGIAPYFHGIYRSSAPCPSVKRAGRRLDNDNRELEIFKIIATSVVIRGNWRWCRTEINRRLEALHLSSHADEPLSHLCKAGWITLTPIDVFELTEGGRKKARQTMGPSTLGGRLAKPRYRGPATSRMWIIAPIPGHTLTNLR